MAVATKAELEITQVIEELPDGRTRVYKITDAHWGDDEDPLTTIIVKGFFETTPTKKG